MRIFSDVWGAVGYRVGTDGSVWSRLEKQSSGRGGIRTTLGTHWVRLVPIKGQGGYLGVTIGGGRKLIHRLVLESFVGPCPEGMQCRHLNGNRQDNRLVNLCWGTPVENWQDRKKHGHGTKGEANPASKLTRRLVQEIRKRRAAGDLLKVLAADYKVSVSLVGAICAGVVWTDT
jgi:hypothetical protein